MLYTQNAFYIRLSLINPSMAFHIKSHSVSVHKVILHEGFMNIITHLYFWWEVDLTTKRQLYLPDYSNVRLCLAEQLLTTNRRPNSVSRSA